MVPPTRRSLLHGITVLAAALAGCSELTDGSAGSTRTATRRADPPDDGPESGRETNPDVLRLRVGGDRPPVWIADPDDDDGGRRTPRDGERFLDSTVIDGPSRVDRVAVAGGVDRTQVDSFLASTDLERETVYLETILVEECFRLELCRIAWRPTRVSTDYTRQGRPYDEHCAVDELVFEVRFIRIPDALDADRVNSHASSIGTGPCEGDRRRADAEGEAGAGRAVPDDGGSPTTTRKNTTGTGTGGEQ